MSYAHTLVKLSHGEKIVVGKSIHPTSCTLNFGEVISIPLTMTQAQDVANALRAWIDEQLGVEAAPTVVRPLFGARPEQPTPPNSAA